MWQQFLLWGKQNEIPLPNTFIYNSMVLKQKLSNSIFTTLAAFFQLTSFLVRQL